MNWFQWLVLLTLSIGSYAAIGCAVGGFATESHVRRHGLDGPNDDSLSLGALTGFFWPVVAVMLVIGGAVVCMETAARKTFGPVVRVGARLRRARDLPKLPEARVVREEKP